MVCDFVRGAVLWIALGTASMPALAENRDYPNGTLLKSVDQLVDAIGYQDAQAELGGPETLRIIDVRSADAFAEGHVPNAINIPADLLSDAHAPVRGSLRPNAELADILGRRGVGPENEIVIYDDRGGFHAAQLFWLLEYFGHTQVSLLNGGIQAWTAAGRVLKKPRVITMADVARGDGPYPVTTFSPSLSPRRYASADWILERKGDRNTVVVDVRPAEAHAKGHIPWAINIPWTANLDADGTMKPARALRTHFEAHGITPDRNIVIHCQDGKASSHSYFALRLLGYPRVRTYHRSWAEWGSSSDLPKTQSTSG